jgi:hypothetical protein
MLIIYITMGVLGSVFSWAKKAIGQVGNVAKTIGSFVATHHRPLSQLAHGVAMMSGNETAQKVTGGLMALSGMATTRQNLNAHNQAYQAARDAGGTGVYNQSTGRFPNM